MPLPAIDTPKFNAWVEKVKKCLGRRSVRESDLLLYLRGFWQQRQTWNKEPKPKNAAEGFLHDQGEEKDLMDRIGNGTEYEGD